MSLQILDSEIHLWHAVQPDFSLQELQQYCLAWLTEKERSRYARYYFDDSRKQLLLGRFLIRSVLSQYRDEIDPGAWRFVDNEFGKPALHPAQNSLPLYFNLSHSADRAVLAVARFECIGVDIERSDKQRRVAKIAWLLVCTPTAPETAAPGARLHRGERAARAEPYGRVDDRHTIPFRAGA